MFDFEGFSSLIAERVVSVLETRYGLVQTPLFVSPEQAAKLLGAGFDHRSVKELCRAGRLPWTRKDEGNPNSHIIIPRQAVLDFAAALCKPEEGFETQRQRLQRAA